MKMEIERKFLVRNDDWRKGTVGVVCRQAYMATAGDHAVRVRISGDRAFIAIKGKGAGISRIEYEYPIPETDAEELIERLCEQPPVEKTRFTIPYGGLLWEIDEFAGQNAGLIVAEVELESEDQVIELPPWVSREVSGEPRYLNINLGKNPYSRWPDASR